MNSPANETEYRQLMATIENYLQKATSRGSFASLTSEEAKELAQLAEIAERYEDSIPLMPIQVPQGIPEMISFKMYERKMNQREMAQLLEIAETRLSEVMRGKRRVSLTLAKQLRAKLGIDADFILENA
ncbi:helix-turn-helix domain-containing protein [Persicitalea jodogahamensis]|uniref:HTH cro/C1-type domain-containing protein n=1 Tax=Persicitalea jodogahamensis TaxID=402147 RepID=A0A8J3D313_9BACT|nr:helix-turn-helix domain-containing protein [Persicitalea jodogahamensis]GHB62806.1 hypothetical protein GCM10007390_15800 [Persicitalea jodogahamensis]